KTSFDEDDPALGRINSLSVAPPFNVSSLKARLAKVEDIGVKNLQLLEDLGAESPMNDSDGIALLIDQYPGSTADEPMAFVCLNSADSLPASKLQEVKTQVKFKVTLTYQAVPDAPAWLSIVKGEILLSDGIKVIERYNKFDYKGYMVTNSAGKRGCE
ncbi:hypothetical protein K443DRAFT_112441, partial [Laccaria amethystina LaAM-08-1]